MPYTQSPGIFVLLLCAVLWAVSGSAIPAVASQEDQCLTLAEFHHDTSTEQLWVHDCGVGWGKSTDCCTWAKVTCDNRTGEGTGNVIELDLSGCGIKGEIGALLSISTTQIVSLAYNELYGPLPSLSSALGLTSLTLYENHLTGPLDSLGTAIGLKLFDGHFNNFTGTLPASLGTLPYLSYISVANNNLYGSIPASWAALTNLGTLGLAYNKLSGSLSPLGAMSKLSVIFLRNNTPGFSGTVPKLPEHLGALYLDNNQLTSLDAASICASAPAGGFKAGCATDWPSSAALFACCMEGDR
jgi:hypothetical protein